MGFQKGNKHGARGRKISDDDRLLLCKATPEAIRRQVELMDSEDERVSLQACTAVLDRYYGKPLQMLDIDATINDSDPYEGLSDDQIDRINEVYSEGSEDDGKSEPS